MSEESGCVCCAGDRCNDTQEHGHILRTALADLDAYENENERLRKLLYSARFELDIAHDKATEGRPSLPGCGVCRLLRQIDQALAEEQPEPKKCCTPPRLCDDCDDAHTLAAVNMPVSGDSMPHIEVKDPYAKHREPLGTLGSLEDIYGEEEARRLLESVPGRKRCTCSRCQPPYRATSGDDGRNE